MHAEVPSCTAASWPSHPTLFTPTFEPQLKPFPSRDLLFYTQLTRNPCRMDHTSSYLEAESPSNFFADNYFLSVLQALVIFS